MRKQYALLRILFAIGLMLLLGSCSSPLDRAREQAEVLLKDLPSVDGANLVCIVKSDRLAQQGTGTHIRLIAVYGTANSYQNVVDFYRESLIAQGWTKYSHTTWDHPSYCNSQYEHLALGLGQVFDTEAICEGADSRDSDADYLTYYSLGIMIAPFDDIGCEAED